MIYIKKEHIVPIETSVESEDIDLNRIHSLVLDLIDRINTLEQELNMVKLNIDKIKESFDSISEHMPYFKHKL